MNKKVNAKDRHDRAKEAWLGDKVDNKGRLHGSPAVEKFGVKQWYREGKLHREDGPAIEWPDGTKLWALNGVQTKFERSNS